MTYHVKEIFYTLQGEGANAGRPAVFCRFAGCNLWSGRESDRSSAVCNFCDTDFFGTDGEGGGIFPDATRLAYQIAALWPLTSHSSGRKFVVCTGGEPLLQLDAPLLQALHDRDFEVAVETNGTRIPPLGLDWVCVSPKAGAEWVLREGNELKLVYPQTGLCPENVENVRFQHFYLQPMDGENVQANTAAAIRYCLGNPKWRLSLQTHKIVGIR